MTSESNGTQMYMPVAPAYGGGNGFGMGGDWGAWFILFLIFGMFGGWGNGNGAGGGFGGGGLYPWMNQSNQINDGFMNQMINDNVTGIRDGIYGTQNQLCNGFAGVTASVTGAQNAITQQLYTNQIAGMQQNFAMQQAFSDCCCENRLANCQTQNIIQNEGNATRFADANNTRDLLTNQTANTQAILDKLCQLELDGVKNQLAQAQRENIALQNQVNMGAFRESQTAQTARILADNAAQTVALEQYLNPVPIPAYQVANPNCCQQNFGCGCGNNF